jgi:hypothetical protein
VVSLAQDQFRIGTVISRSLAVLASNAVPFGILYLIINAPSSIYAFTLAGTPGADEDTGVKLLSFAEAFLGLAAGAAATYATVQELRGRRVGLAELFSRGLAQGGAAIRVALLSGIFLILAIIALIIPSIVFYTMWWVAIPVAVIERPGAMASLRRSAELTRGNRWRVFGLIVCLFAILLAALVLFVIVLFAVFFVSQRDDQTFIDRVTAVATWLLSALFMAVQAVLTAVSYYYLRTAKEGIGIEDIGAVFD